MLGGDAIPALTNVFVNNMNVRLRHVPELFDGDLLFFEAALDKPAHFPHPEAWTRYVTGLIETHQVRCEHGEMTRPEPLAEIATILAARLDALHPMSVDPEKNRGETRDQPIRER